MRQLAACCEPVASGYGAMVSAGDRLLLIGEQTATDLLDSVWPLRSKDGLTSVTPVPASYLTVQPQPHPPPRAADAAAFHTPAAHSDTA